MVHKKESFDLKKNPLMGHHKAKRPPPFGVATRRFANIGYHPALDVTGAMKREITKAGPGAYNVEFPQCKSKRGIDWKMRLESEEFSKFLGFRNANILNERAFYKSLGGPGTCDINEEYFKKSHFAVVPNTGFGTADRFAYLERYTSLPPPNTYQKLDKTSTVNLRQFSNVMSFEWDGFIDRFRGRGPTTLPPNRYDIKDGKGLSDILHRVVSRKGPYELFTGPRDMSTIKNHFAPSTLKVPEYGYVKPSDTDYLLRHKSKRRCGLFLKATRCPKKPCIKSMLTDISLCYRNPNDPGPAHYTVTHKSITAKPKALHPFNTSQVNVRPRTIWKIAPGPGRYNPKAAKCMKSKAPSWVFLSKAVRDVFPVIEYRSF